MKYGEWNSSLEVVKVTAIIMIVLNHSVLLGRVYSGDVFGIASAARDIDAFLVLLFKNLGQIGNNIFLASSV